MVLFLSCVCVCDLFLFLQVALYVRGAVLCVVVCGGVLVACCVVLFMSCVCVCDLFIFLRVALHVMPKTTDAKLPHARKTLHKLNSNRCCVHTREFVWGFGVLFLSCVCLSVSGVLFSVGVCVCVCDMLIFLRGSSHPQPFLLYSRFTGCVVCGAQDNRRQAA